MAAAGLVDRRVEAAFAAVRRENFLGHGPWQILRWDRGYEPSPGRDPVYLYDNVVVAIMPERHLNNGQPSFLAALIASAAPRPGEHAVHIGAGVGYYTAILAHLVGRTGDRAENAQIRVSLYLPAKATGPVPVILCINFGAPPARGGRAGAPATQPARTCDAAALVDSPPNVLKLLSRRTPPYASPPVPKNSHGPAA